MFEREFRYELKESPESATFVGVEDYNDRLSDRSAGAVAARRAHLKALVRELQGFDSRGLNTQDRISRSMMLEDLRLTDAFNTLYGPRPFAGNGGWLVVSASSGPQHLYPALAKATPLRNTRDCENYLKRLAAMPQALTHRIVIPANAGIHSLKRRRCVNSGYRRSPV